MCDFFYREKISLSRCSLFARIFLFGNSYFIVWTENFRFSKTKIALFGYYVCNSILQIAENRYSLTKNKRKFFRIKKVRLF